MLGVYVPPKVFQDIVLRFTKGTSKEGYVKRTIKVIDYCYKVELFESTIHIHKVKREVVYSYYSNGTITIGSNTVSNTYLRPVVDENIPLMKVERKHLYKWELGTIIVKYYDYVRKWGNRVPGEWSPEERDYFWLSCEAGLASGTYYYPIPSAPTFSMASEIAYLDEQFPLELVIYSDLPSGGVGAERTIHYTVDGSTPTDASATFDETHLDIPSPGVAPGTAYTVKALVLHHVDSAVATWLIYKMGDFLFGPCEYWTYDRVALGATIASGLLYNLMLEPLIAQSEPNLVMSGGQVSSGVYTEVIVSGIEIQVEPIIQYASAIIQQGKTWNPIVEVEPPWD